MTSPVDALVAQVQCREMLNQILEQRVGQAFLVRPLRVAKDAIQVLLGWRSRCRAWRCAGPCPRCWAWRARRSSGSLPVPGSGVRRRSLRHRVRDCLGVFLVPDIADALEEEQRQDIALPVGAVDGAAAQDVGGLPQMRFQFGQGQWLLKQGHLLHRLHRFR